jgi:hypothetical protein
MNLETLIGLPQVEAQELIKAAGYTSRVTVIGGQIVLENVTSDFNEKRLNLCIERYRVKHVRVG